jgi:hypothetical protein
MEFWFWQEYVQKYVGHVQGLTCVKRDLLNLLKRPTKPTKECVQEYVGHVQGLTCEKRPVKRVAP